MAQKDAPFQRNMTILCVADAAVSRHKGRGGGAQFSLKELLEKHARRAFVSKD